MNTAVGRWRLIVRDAGTAASAIENLHRCLAKIEERAEKLPFVDDVWFNEVRTECCRELEQAKLSLGKALASLDIVGSRERQWWARVRKRVEAKDRERRLKLDAPNI